MANIVSNYIHALDVLAILVSLNNIHPRDNTPHVNGLAQDCGC